MRFGRWSLLGVIRLAVFPGVMTVHEIQVVPVESPPAGGV